MDKLAFPTLNCYVSICECLRFVLVAYLLLLPFVDFFFYLTIYVAIIIIIADYLTITLSVLSSIIV